MSFTSVPFNDRTILPLNKFSYTETVIRNLNTVDMFVGAIGAHGKRLKAKGDVNKGDYFAYSGALETSLAGIPGHRKKRMINHYNNALANGLIRSTQNERVVVYVPVLAAAANINPGDLVWWDAASSSAKSATAFAWAGNLVTTQAVFGNVFLGVSLDTKVTNDAIVSIRVDISPLSFWDFLTDSATKNAGDPMAPAQQGTNTAIRADKLVVVDHALAMARVARRDGTATTDTLVRVQSAFWGVEWASVEGPQDLSWHL